MANIAFIGLGNMGGPMAANLVKAGHKVTAFDLVAASRDQAKADGAAVGESAVASVKSADTVITMLPAGKHVLSVSVQFAPFKLAKGREWEPAKTELLANVMQALDRHAPGIQTLVERAQVLTPLDLERTYGMTGGDIYHGEPALDQVFTMRPVLGWARYQTPISGLFLCGSGTHPGGGITGGPGQNAAREILRALK